MAIDQPKVSISRAADAGYQDIGRRAQLSYRDLGVRAATGGRYDAKILRIGSGTGDRKVPRHVHKLDIQMIYVINGWVRISFEGIGEVTLIAGDSYLSPGDVPHEVHDWSDDHEVLEFTAPADCETLDSPPA
jgi:uncharacterized RmlC-like cupin family protein